MSVKKHLQKQVLFSMVDLRRFELPTPTMRMWCAPSCATSPFTRVLYPRSLQKSRGKVGGDGEGLAGQGVEKFDALGAEALVGVAELPGISLAFGGAVLGISQDGAADVGTVEPQLVGPARQGLKRHQGMSVEAFQDPDPGPGGLAGGGDVTEQTGQGAAVDGGIDDTLVFNNGISIFLFACFLLYRI